jgi:hypothetical protein
MTADYFKLLKQDEQYLELLSESFQSLKGNKTYIPRKFTEQIQEMKSTTKGTLAGAGLGLAYNLSAPRKLGLGPAALAGGAIAGNLLKRKQIKDMCAKAYKDVVDQEQCFRFRNKFGRMPKNKEELEKGPRKQF